MAGRWPLLRVIVADARPIKLPGGQGAFLQRDDYKPLLRLAQPTEKGRGGALGGLAEAE